MRFFWKGLVGGKDRQGPAPSTRLVAGTYGLAPNCVESEVSLGEWTYFVLEKAGWRPVLYLCTVIRELCEEDR